MINNFCSTAWDREIPFIHYSEPGAATERVVFGCRDDYRLKYAYDYRLAERDYQKWKSSREIEGIPVKTPRYWQEVLRKYCDDPGLELGCIITAVNKSNGY